MGLSICVYCASSSRATALVNEAAEQVGAEMGRRGHELVWGGGDVGAMGIVARACQRAGGRVYGVIPASMVEREVAYHEADELVISADLRQRKALMDARADAFAVLPGGFGTLEELFEILTLRQLGEHQRPIVLFNPGDFWRPLLDLVGHLVEQGVARREAAEMLDLTDDIDELFDLLAVAGEPAPSKWG